MGAVSEPNQPRKTESWETDDGAYSRAKFYCHSTDKRGHSEFIRGPLPPTILAKMSELVQDRNFPDYTSVQAIMRDAIYHRLHEIADIKGDEALRRIVAMEMKMADRARSAYLLRRQQEMVDQIEMLLGLALQAQDELALIEEISKAEADMADLIEPYRSRVIDIIDKYRRLTK